jgi:hypothetical protein
MALAPLSSFRGVALFGSAPTRFNISNKVLTSNVATLTTSAAHGITIVGTIVTVQGVDSTFDGTYLVTAVTSTTFSYIKVTGNVGTVAVSPTGIAIFMSNVTIGGTVTNKIVQNFVATLTTSAAHGLVVNDITAINIGDTIYDTLFAQVIAVPTTTTFCFLVSTATAATTAVTAGAFGKYPPAYTVTAAKTGVTTNIVVANPTSAAVTFSIVVNGIILHGSTSLPANSNYYVDLKQPAAALQTIIVSASVPQVTMHIAGVEF